MSEQEVIKILNQLSDTGNRAFEILVQQAVYDAWLCLVSLILLIIFVVGLVIKCNKIINNATTQGERGGAQLVIGLSVITYTGIFCVLIFPLITGFINPEYLAIKELLGAL